jgi:hypothetical protein
MYIFSKGEYVMNWDAFYDLWNDFLKYMDRVVQWMKFLFTGDGDVTERPTWPPKDYPDFNA